MRDKPANETAKSDENADRRSNAIDDGVSRERQNARATVLSSKPQARANRQFLWIYVGVIGSLLLRGSVLDFESGDYKAFLSNWYDYFVEHGRWAALKHDFSYPPLYLYLLSLSTLLSLPKLYAIKLISILCDYVAAWFAFKIVRCKYQDGPLPIAAAFLILYLPTVWLNSAVWGQCDTMFTSALLATLYYLIAKRPFTAMAAFGVACSLKPQAIFFVPFLGGIFFRERLPWKCVVIPPLVYAVCGLPAMLAGKPVLHVLFHWGRQHNYEHCRSKFEVVIADNASTDGTLKIARELCRKHDSLRVAHLNQKGRGRAIKKVWMESNADILSYMDVDLSTNLNAFPPLIESLMSGGFDVATGSRLLKPSLTTRRLKRDITDSN